MPATTEYFREIAALWPVIGLGALLFAVLRGRPPWIASRLSANEARALSGFAAIALVVWPLLPEGRFGPYGAWNPRQLVMVVVVVSGLSLAGHWVARLAGERRGALVTAAAGAIVSSTAVTVAMAQRLREGRPRPAGFQAAIAAGTAMMFLRVTLVVGVIAPFALPTFATLTLPGIAVSLAGTALFLGRERPTGSAGNAESAGREDGAGGGESRGSRDMPTDLLMLGPALALMALVMLMSVLARMALARYGDQGLVTVLAISGALDIDSAVMTMGGLPPGTIDPVTAGLILLPPLVLNSLVKIALSIGIAGWSRGGPPAGVMALAMLAALMPVIWLI